MGQYAKRLHKKLASKSSGLPAKAPERRPGEPLPGGVTDMETMIKQGYDPIHAAYAYIQQMSAHFAECVSHLSEMKAWARTVEKAEDEYMPAGPPMSPLTRSYFWLWALYDLRIGKSTDTLAYCQIAANDVPLMNPHQLDALKTLAASRMGIYEHIGREGPHIRLRELMTDDQFVCLCPAGYVGRKGELWYVRLTPPLEPQLAPYWIAMTTSYILTEASKADWLVFLKRAMVPFNAEVEAYIEFDADNLGSFQFGYVQGDIDYRLAERDGKPCVEFSWEGGDGADGTPLTGRGWAALEGDKLNGIIFIHRGDESGFATKRLKGKPKRATK